MLDQVFAGIARDFSSQFGGPFHDATAKWPGVPVKDDGGSITTPAAPVTSTCKVQVSQPDAAMRGDAGFVQTDMRLYVLAATLTGSIDTTTTITLASGPHAGTWEVQAAQKDTAGIGWACRGRKVP